MKPEIRKFKQVLVDDMNVVDIAHGLFNEMKFENETIKFKYLRDVK